MRLTKSYYAIQRGRRPRRQQSARALPSSMSFSSLPFSPSLSVKLSPQFLTDSILDLAAAASTATVVLHTRYTPRSTARALLGGPQLRNLTAVEILLSDRHTIIKEGI